MKEKIIEIMYMVEKMPPSKLETDIIIKLMELKDIFSIDNTNVIAHNGKEVSEELKTILKLSTDVMFLKDSYNNLNKGIDELIEKYEEEMNIYTNEINNWNDERKNSDDSNYKEYCMCIIERNKESKTMARDFITDLKKLKGE